MSTSNNETPDQDDERDNDRGNGGFFSFILFKSWWLERQQ